MKIIFLVPPAMNIETICRSIPKEWNHEVEVQFIGTHAFASIKYDLIIYTGATEGIYSFSIYELKRLKEFDAKTIHISTAGGDHNWWPLLEQYAKEDVFDLTVNIDGYQDWPKRPQDLTLIGCVDPTPYEVPCEKDIALGCNFAEHPARNHFINQFGKDITRGPRSEVYGQHAIYSDFLKRCRVFLNVNWTSPDEVVKHVNMKVLEAGLAGCILWEKKDSWVNKWFAPGIDYFEYKPKDVIDFAIANEKVSDEKTAAKNLSNKVRTQYSNVNFWTKVFEALNLPIQGA